MPELSPRFPQPRSRPMTPVRQGRVSPVSRVCSHMSPERLSQVMTEIEEKLPTALKIAPESPKLDDRNNVDGIAAVIADPREILLENQMTHSIKKAQRHKILKEWEIREQRRMKSLNSGKGKDKDPGENPSQTRRRNAIRLYEERWMQLIVEEGMLKDQVVAWRGFSDLPWPTFDLASDGSDQPLITPLNFPVTFESMSLFMLSKERQQMRGLDDVFPILCEEMFCWDPETFETRIWNKIREEDLAVVLYACNAIYSWMKGDIEHGNYYKACLEYLAPFWRASNVEEEVRSL